jgi:hypothetical protein
LRQRPHRNHHSIKKTDVPSPFIYATAKGISIVDYTGQHFYIDNTGGKISKEEINLRREKGLRL